jgi:hypothetical protein
MRLSSLFAMAFALLALALFAIPADARGRRGGGSCAGGSCGAPQVQYAMPAQYAMPVARAQCECGPTCPGCDCGCAPATAVPQASRPMYSAPIINERHGLFHRLRERRGR